MTMARMQEHHHCPQKPTSFGNRQHLCLRPQRLPCWLHEQDNLRHLEPPLREIWQHPTPGP